MINRRHHDRRQLKNIVWCDLEERRKADDRRVEVERRALRSIKKRAFWARWSFHLAIIGTVLFYIILLTTSVAK